jgi:hypothetical protein
MYFSDDSMNQWSTQSVAVHGRLVQRSSVRQDGGKGDVMLRSIIVAILVYSFSFGVSPTVSQTNHEDGEELYVWLDGGIGSGSIGRNSSIELSLLTKLGMMSARYSSFEGQNKGYIAQTRDGIVIFDLDEISLLFGKAFRRDYWMASASIGVSLLNSDQLSGGSDIVEGYHPIGIPVQGEVFLTPMAMLGFGVVLTANLNDLQSYTTASVNIRFGILRYVRGS